MVKKVAKTTRLETERGIHASTSLSEMAKIDKELIKEKKGPDLSDMEQVKSSHIPGASKYARKTKIVFKNKK